MKFKPNATFKKWMVVMMLVSVIVIITSIFWKSELVYSLPTPVPEHYSEVKMNSLISLDDQLKWNNNLPTFIHFFNPECPCSRFNIPHFKTLVREYHDKINFAMVILQPNKKFTEKEIQEKFDLDIPVFFDKNIATKCGVYSTPQAVILNSESRLYFRGNYNQTRYCTNKESEYARMAIDSILNNNTNPDFSKQALKAYGCSLPTCKK